MIRLDNISKIYENKNSNNEVFKEINICFNSYGLYYILGDNGTGKTTIFNILLGNDIKYDGTYFFDDINITKLNHKQLNNFRNNNISVITQSTNLIKELNVFDNILIALRNSKYNYTDKNKIILSVLSSVGLEGFEKRKVNNLSSGEAQRVAIARALVTRPKVLLADEITSNLDMETANAIMELLKKLSKDFLVIVITHNSILVDNHKGFIYELKDKSINNKHKVIENKKETLSLENKEYNYKNLGKIITSLYTSKLIINIFYSVIIMISLIFIILSFSYFLSNNEKNELKSLYDNGLTTIRIEGDNIVENEHIIKSKTLNPLFIPSPEKKDFKIKNIIELNKYIYDFNVIGKIPQNKNEVLVTDYYLKKLTLEQNQVLNQQFEIRIDEKIEIVVITGIIRTNYSELMEKPLSHSTNKIINDNIEIFYNSFFVTNDFFDNYKVIGDSFNFYISPETNKNNQIRNEKSLDTDILYGRKAVEVNEIVLNYYSIREIFDEYRNIETYELERVFNEINNKNINLYYFDFKTIDFIKLDLKVVGINILKKSSNGVSEELLSKITKSETNPNYLLRLSDNINKLSNQVNTLKKQGAIINLNIYLNKDEIEPYYSNFLVLLQIIVVLSIFFLLLFISIIIVITYIYIKNQTMNIKTLSLIGYSDYAIGKIYFFVAFIKIFIGSIASIIFSSVISNIINGIISTNNYDIKYTLLVNISQISIIFSIVVSLIGGIICPMLIFKFLKKGRQ